MNEQSEIKGLKEWTPGCYGLKYPATLIAVNGVVHRLNKGIIEILTGVRGPGRWQAGKPMICCYGGFVDPTDKSARDALVRELNEELPGLTLEVDKLPFCETGPVKYEHYWNPEIQKAVGTEVLSHDLPVITWYYLARWIAGEPKSSDEALDVKWRSLKDLAQTKSFYEFDSARALAGVIKKFL